MSAIHCAGCTACCHQDVVRLADGERDHYQWHYEWENGRRFAALDRRPDGGCVYLTVEGCGIHGSAPGICQRMDCRVLLKDTLPAKREDRVRQSPQMIHIYLAGALRMHTLAPFEGGAECR